MDEIQEKLDRIIDLLEQIVATTAPIRFEVKSGEFKWMKDTIIYPYVILGDTGNESPSPFEYDLTGEGGTWPYQPTN